MTIKAYNIPENMKTHTPAELVEKLQIRNGYIIDGLNPPLASGQCGLQRYNVEDGPWIAFEVKEGHVERVYMSGSKGERDKLKKDLGTILMSESLSESTEPLNLTNHPNG